MRLKLAISGLGQNIITLKENATLSDLVKAAETAFENQISVASVGFGYPPKKISINEEDGNSALTDLGISSGERVSLEPARNTANPLRPEGQFAADTRQSQNKKPLTKTQIYIKDSQILQVHQVPDDNSCLFHAISYAMYKDITVSSQLREIVSKEISANKTKFSDSILGRPNQEYANWILQRDSWGGAIDIVVLSSSLEVAILTLDVDALRYEKFNEDKYDSFIMVVFSGVHYDTIEVYHEANDERQTVFRFGDPDSENLLVQAIEVAKKMKAAGMSFNTTRDRIKCNTCGSILIGEREVARHAERTGHMDFGQVSA
ncbi:HDL553Cp [Eremothecium sinecaudum]|uniref:Ubiquitin thioesterase OTU n=1 Tax=Eremothecium sinecaudum TaxID=45286 RepID=A0A120K225_9SACH|nr:HDL553Cp [Eremothecium sinecaudum]AMD20191.1 HDL553Cp [Eremothecium sinecaudum]